jgi:ubiquitin-protein ligase
MNIVRLRRLQADYEAVRRLMRHMSSKISIKGVSGNPPERYIINLKVSSLRQVGYELTIADEHELEIRMPQGYPRDAPVCRLLTPVFHPNIAPHAVCIGDHWTADESLDRMIMRICEMLAFQSYNIKSPLNGEASQWVENHIDRLPLDHGEFFIDLEDSFLQDEQKEKCSNCEVLGKPLQRCASEHLLCDDCIIYCGSCGSVLCLTCGLEGHQCTSKSTTV